MPLMQTPEFQGLIREIEEKKISLLEVLQGISSANYLLGERRQETVFDAFKKRADSLQSDDEKKDFWANALKEYTTVFPHEYIENRPLNVRTDPWCEHLFSQLHNEYKKWKKWNDEEPAKWNQIRDLHTRRIIFGHLSYKEKVGILKNDCLELERRLAPLIAPNVLLTPEGVDLKARLESGIATLKREMEFWEKNDQIEKEHFSRGNSEAGQVEDDLKNGQEMPDGTGQPSEPTVLNNSEEASDERQIKSPSGTLQAWGIYYLLKFAKLNFDEVGQSDIHKLMALLTGKTESGIKSAYETVRQNPNTITDKRAIKARTAHLKALRDLFEKLGMHDVVQAIDDDLNAVKRKM